MGVVQEKVRGLGVGLLLEDRSGLVKSWSGLSRVDQGQSWIAWGGQGLDVVGVSWGRLGWLK